MIEKTSGRVLVYSKLLLKSVLCEILWLDNIEIDSLDLQMFLKFCFSMGRIVLDNQETFS